MYIIHIYVHTYRYVPPAFFRLQLMLIKRLSSCQSRQEMYIAL